MKYCNGQLAEAKTRLQRSAAINPSQGRTQRARECDGVDDFDFDDDDDGNGEADLLDPAAGTVATAAAIVGAATMTGATCCVIGSGCRECRELLTASAGSGRD